MPLKSYHIKLAYSLMATLLPPLSRGEERGHNEGEIRIRRDISLA